MYCTFLKGYSISFLIIPSLMDFASVVLWLSVLNFKETLPSPKLNLSNFQALKVLNKIKITKNHSKHPNLLPQNHFSRNLNKKCTFYIFLLILYPCG